MSFRDTIACSDSIHIHIITLHHHISHHLTSSQHQHHSIQHHSIQHHSIQHHSIQHHSIQLVRAAATLSRANATVCLSEVNIPCSTYASNIRSWDTQLGIATRE